MIRLSKYEVYDYNRHPMMLVAGATGSGKSRFLYGLIMKMREVTSDENLYILDAKFEELEEVAKDKMKLPNVSSSTNDIVNMVQQVLEIMNHRHSEKLKKEEPIFTVIDEYIALRLKLNKVTFTELENNLKEVVLLGRSVNVHIILGMQRVDAKSIDLNIRDSMAIRIGFGTLSSENFKMLFAISKSECQIEDKDIGEGYIKMDGQEIRSFTAPRVWLSEEEKPPKKRKWSLLRNKK